MAKRGRKPGSKPVGRQLDTLIKPGERRNPSGRSSAHQRMQVALEETMQQFLEQKVDVQVGGKKVKMRRMEALLNKLFKEAMEGKAVVPAISEMFDRGFGKAKQAIEYAEVAPVTIEDDIPNYELPAPNISEDHADGPPSSTEKAADESEQQ